MKRQLKEIRRPLVGLLAIAGVIALPAPSFRQWAAVEDVLESSSVLFIMCTGMTIALIGSCLDLSVGSIYALVSVVIGQMLISGLPVPVCILGGLAAGAACGLINGTIVARMGIPTLIATLGTQIAFRGIANMIGTGPPRGGGTTAVGAQAGDHGANPGSTTKLGQAGRTQDVRVDVVRRASGPGAADARPSSSTRRNHASVVAT